MSEYFAGVKKVIDNSVKIFNALDFLEKTDLLVGIPENKTERKSGEPTNAQLAYIHENGSPLKKIPARPFLRPSIEANKDEIAESYSRTIPAALDGNKNEVEKILNQTGALASGMASDWFTDSRNNWSPLAPSTILARARKKYRISRYKTKKTKDKYRSLLAAYIANGEFRPLIDSSQLRRSISWVIRNK